MLGDPADIVHHMFRGFEDVLVDSLQNKMNVAMVPFKCYQVRIVNMAGAERLSGFEFAIALELLCDSCGAVIHIQLHSFSG